MYTPAAALLAGIGIDALLPAKRLTFIARLGAAGGGGITLTALAARSLLSGIEVTFFAPLALFGAWFSLSMILLLWGQRRGIVTRVPEPPRTPIFERLGKWLKNLLPIPVTS